MSAIALRSRTAKTAAPIPINSATPLSSHTLRFTVKSRSADGCDLIGSSSQQSLVRPFQSASRPLRGAVPSLSALAHDLLRAYPGPARPCVSLLESPAAGQQYLRFAPATLRAPTDRPTRPRCDAVG